jgi:hypothetical protein
VGFNGDIVVLRSTKALAELTPFVGTPGHPVDHEWLGVDGWRFVHVRHFDHPYMYDRPMLEELSAATAGPVMVCNVFESDVAYLQGSSSAGYWEGWLDPGSAALYQAGQMLDDSGNDVFDDEGAFVDTVQYGRMVQQCADKLALERPQVAQAVVDWAAAAGRDVDLEAVVKHLELARDPFVQQLFFDLLEIVGISA